MIQMSTFISASRIVNRIHMKRGLQNPKIIYANNKIWGFQKQHTSICCSKEVKFSFLRQPNNYHYKGEVLRYKGEVLRFLNFMDSVKNSFRANGRASNFNIKNNQNTLIHL